MRSNKARRCHRRSCLGILGLLYLLAATGIAAVAADFRVVLLSSSHTDTYQRVSIAIAEGLRQDCPRPCEEPIELIRLDAGQTDSEMPASGAELLVSIGSRAAKRLAREGPETARLYGFIPYAVWHELGDCCAGARENSSALFIDQPSARYFELIRLVFPEARRVGVLVGESTRLRQTELAEAASRSGHLLQSQTVDDPDQVGRGLRYLLDHVDVLLALPDPAIYNAHTIHSILLASYSARVPVVAYSDPMVKAGAAAAVYMSPEDVGLTMARSIAAYRANGRLDPPQFGTHFSVSVNHDVLRSLGTTPVSEAELQRRLSDTLR